MKYLNFKPTTAGEHLFQHIIRDVIGENSHLELQNLGLLKAGGRAPAFFDYFLGTYAFNFLGRCLRKAASIQKAIEDEALHQGILTQYFQKTLELPNIAGERNLDQLAHLSLFAASYSGKAISKRTKSSVRNGQETCTCYICGKELLRKTDIAELLIKYEHVWPSSYGGDSTTGNLLPACEKCNSHKADMLLWQDSHIHSFILSPSPNEEEWKKITRTKKIAKHRARVFEFACTRNLSLKEAAIEIGPIDVSLQSLYSIDEDDCIDFFNFDIKEKI
ncbi:HNH endonuclease [Pseudomonas stutzeri]|uniref:HNH endonuclease n=1 Tax=Stutzerimonas stutzeri TaxID=316 RepID=UPI00210946F4|nr:HNH endonuclease [Stutzerimonas stutzeri]MCQ4292932.1 HNH endonuclease [Stutzerimonas stutzeri]